MLQALTAPPSSGQWFALPRCCSLTGQGPDPRNCAHTHTRAGARTGGGGGGEILEVCAKKVSTNTPQLKRCFIVAQINADFYYFFVSTQILGFFFSAKLHQIKKLICFLNLDKYTPGYLNKESTFESKEEN